jgi:hypothetical protein
VRYRKIKSAKKGLAINPAGKMDGARAARRRAPAMGEKNYMLLAMSAVDGENGAHAGARFPYP